MGFLRSIVYLVVLAALTFTVVVFLKHGPGGPTEFADGVRQEIAAINWALRGIRERLPDTPFVAPES